MWFPDDLSQTVIFLSTFHVLSFAAYGVGPMLQVPQPAPAPSLILSIRSLKQAMMELKEGMISPEVENLGTLFVKSRLKESNDGNRWQGKHKLTNNFGNKFHLLYFVMVYSMQLHQEHLYKGHSG